MRITAALVIVGATTATVSAAPDQASEIAAAVKANNVKAFRRNVGFPVDVIGVVWSDKSCAAQFGTTDPVPEEKAAALVKCLGTLGLRANDGSLEYGVGFLLGARVHDVHGRSMVYSFETPLEDSAPALEYDVLTTFQIGAKPYAPTAEVKGETKQKGYVAAVASWCVVGGKVANVDVTPFQGNAFASAVEADIKSRRYGPLAYKGTTVDACTVYTFVYPESARAAVNAAIDALPAPGPEKPVSGPGLVRPDLPAPPPPPPPPSGAFAEAAIAQLEANRIAGDKVIQPDDLTKTQFSQSDEERIIGSYKMCLDVTGKVTSVTILKPSGYDAYDRKVLRTIKTWAYKPFMKDGKAIAVCSAVTYVYAQK